jgi:hypothetical protein
LRATFGLLVPDIVGEIPQGDNKDRDAYQNGGEGLDNSFFHANKLSEIE